MRVRHEVIRVPARYREWSWSFSGAGFAQGSLLIAAVALAAGLVLVEPSPTAYFVQLAVVAAALILGRSAYMDRRGGATVLIGSSPLASVAASLLAERRSRVGGTVLHVATVADAATLVGSHRCSEIIVADPGAFSTAALVDVRGIRPTVTSGPDAVERLIGRVPIRIDDGPRGRISQLAHERGRTYEAIKRGVDIVVATGLGLGMLLILPLVALAIRLDSPGPIFYSQLRVGLNGRAFRIYKFRSMRTDAEKNGATWATVGDARVTRVGRWLRLSRIDELPQVWNLLRGDMTMVGPRPERPEFTSVLEAEIPAYGTRHRVKPGLTGWAQVRFRYTASVRDTEAKLEYDLFYVKYRSLAMDLRVMAQTILVVIRMRGC